MASRWAHHPKWLLPRPSSSPGNHNSSTRYNLSLSTHNLSNHNPSLNTHNLSPTPNREESSVDEQRHLSIARVLRLPRARQTARRRAIPSFSQCTEGSSKVRVILPPSLHFQIHCLNLLMSHHRT